MTGLNIHPIMTRADGRERHDDVVETTLSLLQDRRRLIHAKARVNQGSTQRMHFQMEVARMLEGSLLPADQRRTLMTLAGELGLRTFEATLMIAMAQDRARNDLPPVEEQAFAHSFSRSIDAGAHSKRSPLVVHFSTAVCTGVLLASTLIVLMTA